MRRIPTFTDEEAGTVSNICENCARRFCCQFNAQTRKVCGLYDPDIALIKSRETMQAFDEAYSKLSAYCGRLMTENFAASLGLKAFAMYLSLTGQVDTLAKLEDCLCDTEEQA